MFPHDLPSTHNSVWHTWVLNGRLLNEQMWRRWSERVKHPSWTWDRKAANTPCPPSLPAYEHSALGLNPCKFCLGLKYHRAELRTAALMKSVPPCSCTWSVPRGSPGLAGPHRSSSLGGGGSLAPTAIPTVGAGWGPRGLRCLGLLHGPAIQQGWFWAHTPMAAAACSATPLHLDPSPQAQLLLS